MCRALSLIALGTVAAFATAGFAEWEITTPGGNLISSVDPLVSTHGTCLRSARPEAIYLDYLGWWRYYRNAITGKARKGFFIFKETSHAVSFFASEAELDRAIVERRLGAPAAARMTPDDGWRQVWTPFLTERCRLLTTPNNAEYQAADGATKAGMRAFCEQVKSGAFFGTGKQ